MEAIGIVNINKLIFMILLFGLLFAYTASYAHKGVEPFPIKEWRSDSSYSLDKKAYYEIPLHYAVSIYHTILDRVDLSLSHYPIENVNGSQTVDHSRRGYAPPIVYLDSLDLDSQKKMIVRIGYPYKIPFTVYFYIDLESQSLIDNFYSNSNL